ncbi:MAG: ferredoxin domain-containing protein [Anaerolineales bacterium]
MEAVEIVAQMMEISAITAPKTKGENFIQVKTIKGEQLESLAKAMIAFGERKNKRNFDRDARNIRQSEAVVLIGIKDTQTAGLNCGACGYSTCAELEAAPKFEDEFRGPTCAYRILDMGIALGSAVKTASLFNVDNRIMYRIGAVARDLGLVDWDFVMGIPLSVSGKNIYFDR